MESPHHKRKKEVEEWNEKRKEEEELLDLMQYIKELERPLYFAFGAGDKRVFVVAERVHSPRGDTDNYQTPDYRADKDGDYKDQMLVLADVTPLYDMGFGDPNMTRDPWLTDTQLDIFNDQRYDLTECDYMIRRPYGPGPDPIRSQRHVYERGPHFYFTERATHDGYYMSKCSVEYHGKEFRQNILGQVRVGGYIFVEDVHYHHLMDEVTSKTNRVFVILGSLPFDFGIFYDFPNWDNDEEDAEGDTDNAEGDTDNCTQRRRAPPLKSL
jgi:hypothetical protein